VELLLVALAVGAPVLFAPLALVSVVVVLAAPVLITAAELAVADRLDDAGAWGAALLATGGWWYGGLAITGVATVGGVAITAGRCIQGCSPGSMPPAAAALFVVALGAAGLTMVGAPFMPVAATAWWE
jgi:hypothetical protein